MLERRTHRILKFKKHGVLTSQIVLIYCNGEVHLWKGMPKRYQCLTEAASKYEGHCHDKRYGRFKKWVISFLK